MAGTSSGLRKAWKERTARYGKSGVAPEIRDARRAGSYEKKTVAILDKPFRLSNLTPDILAHWRAEYAQTGQRIDRIINSWIRKHGGKREPTRRELENSYRDAALLLRHFRQYRRALETGTAYLEKHGKKRRGGR